MISAAALDALLAAGATAEMIVAAVKADAAQDDERRVRRREQDAERQRRHRERNALSRVTDRDSADMRDETPTPDKSPQTPKINPTPGEHTHTQARGPVGSTSWKCPVGVDPAHWRDFLVNRRTKRLGYTATAYRAQLKALDTLADDDWPPGRIVQFAAERGWGAFFDPRGRDDGRRNGANGMGRDHRASGGRGVTIDAAGDFIADVRGHPN